MIKGVSPQSVFPTSHDPFLGGEQVVESALYQTIELTLSQGGANFFAPGTLARDEKNTHALISTMLPLVAMAINSQHCDHSN